MEKKTRVEVVLTPEAVEALTQVGGPLVHSLKEGKYFNCFSVEQEGYFLHLDMPERFSSDGRFRASIPLSYVSYMISAVSETGLGFRETQGPRE
jgi:hypothetical protein